jgi:hypothetical protein
MSRAWAARRSRATSKPSPSSAPRACAPLSRAASPPPGAARSAARARPRALTVALEPRRLRLGLLNITRPFLYCMIARAHRAARRLPRRRRRRHRRRRRRRRRHRLSSPTTARTREFRRACTGPGLGKTPLCLKAYPAAVRRACT